MLVLQDTTSGAGQRDKTQNCSQQVEPQTRVRHLQPGPERWQSNDGNGLPKKQYVATDHAGEQAQHHGDQPHSRQLHQHEPGP